MSVKFDGVLDKMTYRGYDGSVEYDEDDKTQHGKILNIDDLVLYGAEIHDIETAFKDAVDDYIDTLEYLKLVDQNKEMKELLTELDEYLCYNELTTIHSGSILHTKIKDVLNKVRDDTDV